MILTLDKNANEQNADELIKRLEFMNFRAVKHEENNQYLLAVVEGVDHLTRIDLFNSLPFVKEVKPFTKPFKLAGKEIFKKNTVIDINGKKIGGNKVVVFAGSCAVESEEQIFETAKLVAGLGATILRGGAFKPRTSPYSFQGLGEEGLKYMHDAAKKYNLLTTSEAMDTQHVELVANYVDIIQIGTRNMQNFNLLKQVGRTKKPILLKRGFSATYNDFLMAAEYILSEGNPHVILCERGIRTFETYTRNTLDIVSIPVLHELSHLPVIVDPSHGTGIRSLVVPMSRSAVAAGADGLMVEVHPEPDKALSDKEQTIGPELFKELMKSLDPISKAIGRTI